MWERPVGELEWEWVLHLAWRLSQASHSYSTRSAPIAKEFVVFKIVFSSRHLLEIQVKRIGGLWIECNFFLEKHISAAGASEQAGMAARVR